MFKTKIYDFLIYNFKFVSLEVHLYRILNLTINLKNIML